MIVDEPNRIEESAERPDRGLAADEVSGETRGMSDGERMPWSAQQISFPDIIETTDNSPVLLSSLLELDGQPSS